MTANDQSSGSIGRFAADFFIQRSNDPPSVPMTETRLPAISSPGRGGAARPSLLPGAFQACNRLFQRACSAAGRADTTQLLDLSSDDPAGATPFSMPDDNVLLLREKEKREQKEVRNLLVLCLC